MRLRLCAATLVLVAAAGCSGNGDSKEVTTPTASSPAATAPTFVASLPATVDTSGSGCDTKKNGPGDCWLPLYSKPGLQGEPLNLGDKCQKDDQKACWPQPGDPVVVTCQTTVKGVTYNGVTVPAGKWVAKPGATAPGRGFAEARFLRLEGQASTLGPCILGG